MRKVTIAFFVFLLGIFTLNYAICATQNNAYLDRIKVLDLLFQMTEKVPSTTRFIRTCVNIANGFESNMNEVIPDRFTYYMGRISENAEQFREI